MLSNVTVHQKGHTFGTAVFADYSEFLVETEELRISTGLRLMAGGATLDVKAITGPERISEIVGLNDYEGNEVLPLGFSDSFRAASTLTSHFPNAAQPLCTICCCQETLASIRPVPPTVSALAQAHQPVAMKQHRARTEPPCRNLAALGCF